MKDARCKFLQTRIPGPTGPFASLSNRVVHDASNAAKETGTKLWTEVEALFLRIQNAFNAMKKTSDADCPDGKKFRTELHTLVAEVRRITEGVCFESLELCEQYK